VVQAPGVHDYHLGDKLNVYVNPRHLFAFDSEGNLAAAPSQNAVDRLRTETV